VNAGARELRQQTLATQRRVLGGEHPNTLGSMNNLAETLRDLASVRHGFWRFRPVLKEE
jgi:tetratricopeptide repeat protein